MCGVRGVRIVLRTALVSLHHLQNARYTSSLCSIETKNDALFHSEQYLHTLNRGVIDMCFL